MLKNRLLRAKARLVQKFSLESPLICGIGLELRIPDVPNLGSIIMTGYDQIAARDFCLQIVFI